MIVSSFIGLVSKEVDLIILLQESQAISLVPANWENIKTDLPSNRIFDSKIWKLLMKDFNELFPDKMLVVKLLEVISLSLRAVSTDRGNVDESSSVLDKSASLDRDIDISQVMKTKGDEFFQLGFSQEIFD